MKFRKKPIVIDAIQATADNGMDVARFLGMLDMPGNKIEENLKRGYSPPELFILKTLEGDMIVRAGDWIIKGVNGEFYPCKPDIFEKTYEPAE